MLLSILWTFSQHISKHLTHCLFKPLSVSCPLHSHYGITKVTQWQEIVSYVNPFEGPAFTECILIALQFQTGMLYYVLLLSMLN